MTDRPGGLARWRVIVTPPAEGAGNMAIDHALAICHAPDEGVLRLYGWTPPTISFGRNEPTVERYDPRHIAAAGLGCVRRPTGGRAVLHHREVTYAAVVPARAFGGPRRFYLGVHRALARALGVLGIPAGLAEAGPGRAPGPDAGPCFGHPAPGEIVVQGRKLVGSAQARIEGAVLQHGSVILGGDQTILDEITRGPLPSEEWGSRDISIEEVLGREPSVESVHLAVEDGFRKEFGGDGWERGPLEVSVRREAKRLSDRYASDEWTWRR